MRQLIVSAAAVLGVIGGAPALAAAASVTVAIGPELQKKAERTYGVREVDDLAEMLRGDVERKLADTGAYDGARIELVLVDAVPNRPTFKQLTDRPSLSMQSFGLGGATIEGRAISPDGAVTPLAYRWHESDLRNAYGYWTWANADKAFSRFARRLSRGETVISR